MPEQQTDDMNTDDVKTDDLSAAIIEGATRSFDFNSGVAKWGVAFSRSDDEINNEQWVPMMNTLWPLPDNFDVPDDVRDRLDNMTIVNVHAPHLSTDNGLWLALTGGGMDMSWNIARTYVNLGYLPPATLGDLPEMAGMEYTTPGNQRVIQALHRSHDHMIDRHRRRMHDLEALGEGE